MPNLRTLRHRLGQVLGGHLALVTGVEVGQGSYTNMASGTDAARVIASSDLADLNLVGTGSDTNNTYFDAAWAFLPDTQEQRRVVLSGYRQNQLASDVTTAVAATTAGNMRVGTLTLHRPLSQVLPPGTPVEIHKWPVLDADRKTGLHSLLNRGLRALVTKDTITIPGVNSQYRYSLATYPWLLDEAQLLKVRDYESTIGMDAPGLPGGGALRIDGETPYLILASTVASGRTFSVDVLRPRSSLVQVGGTWGPSSVGLVNDTDAVTGREDEIVLAAEYFACREQARYDPAREAGTWAFRAREIAQIIGPSFRLDLVTGSGGDSDSMVSATGDSAAFLASREGGEGIDWP